MKLIFLTGATDGIGFETAKLLAAQGHELLISGRSESKLAATKRQLHTNFPESKVVSYCADLSNFSDVQTLVQAISEEHKVIDVIINNAGVLKSKEPLTRDGLDIRFVVNTYSPLIIAASLLPFLADDGRIINLSSAAQEPVSLDAMTGRLVLMESFQAYAQSKLAMTMWSRLFANLLKSNQVVVSVNPGSLLASKMVKEGFGIDGNDLAVGANILARAALSGEFASASGKYYDNDAQQFSSPHPDALDETKCLLVMKAMREIFNDKYSNNPIDWQALGLVE